MSSSSPAVPTEPATSLPADPAGKWRWGHEALVLLLLVCLAGFLLLRQLGDASFHDVDEALYAQIAVEMDASGDWLTPTYWGTPFHHKPPLAYWLMAAARRLLPDASIELQARLPSALASLALLALVYWTTRRLSGVFAGACAVLLLLGNGQFLYEHAARTANLDALLMLACFAVLAFGARAHAERWARIASAAAVAMVAMVKAPIAAFPGLAVFSYLLARRPQAARQWLGWVALSGVALVLPWHAHQLWLHPDSFWNNYVLFEIFGRASGTKSMYARDTFVHLRALWRSFSPLGPLVFAANAAALVYFPPPPSEPGRDAHAVCRMLAGFCAFFFAVLCAIPGKWPWYALIGQPAMAVVAVVFMTALARGRFSVLLPPILAALAAGRLLLLDLQGDYLPAARASFLWPRMERMLRRATELPSAIEILVACLFVAASALVLSRRVRQSASLRAKLAAALAIGTLAIGVSTVAAVPVAYRAPVDDLARALANRGIERVYLLGFYREARYGGRLGPMSSVYLRNIPGATTIDCHSDPACAAAGSGAGAAVIVHEYGAEPVLSHPEFARALASSGRPWFRLSELDWGPLERDGP